MTAQIISGFDKYGTPDPGPNTLSGLTLLGVMSNEWALMAGTGAGFAMDIVPGLNGRGQAIKLTGASANNMGITRANALGTALTRALLMVWLQWGGTGGLASSGGSVMFTKGVANANFCCTIGVDASGHLTLKTGDSTGATIATSTQTVVSGGVNFLAIDITFGASSAFNVYLNNVLALTGTGNTGNGQTSADNIVFGNHGTGFNTGATITVDHVFLCDTVAAPNNTLVTTGPVIDSEWPSSDSQAQFTNTQGTLGPAAVLTANVIGATANTVFLRKFTPGLNCTLQSVAWYPTSANAAQVWKACVYSDSSGSPNTILSDGNANTGYAANTLQIGSLVTPQALTAGTPYWIGIARDSNASPTVAQNDNNTNVVSKAITYPTLPSPLTGITTGVVDHLMFGLVTGVTGNFSAVNSNPPPMPTANDLSFVSSSTVGNEDLYGFPALPVTPATIYAMQVSAFMRNSDAGARTINLQTKSSGTDSPGNTSGQSPSTTYGWLASIFEVDPATAAAWLTANLNAAVSGEKIAT